MKSPFLFSMVLLCLPILAIAEEPESNWEIWQWENFYGLGAEFFADEDGDGISNFVEFGFGLDPLRQQFGPEYSADLSITPNADGDIELSLWQPELEDEFLGEGDFYGRKWFSIAFQSSVDGKNWDVIADKVGASTIWGFQDIEVISERQLNGRFKIRIIDRRPRVNAPTRFYRMVFYLAS